MHDFITLSNAFYAIMLKDKTVTTFNHLNGMPFLYKDQDCLLQLRFVVVVMKITSH